MCNFDILDALLIDTVKMVILVKVTQKNSPSQSPILVRGETNNSINEPLNNGPSGPEISMDKISYKMQVWEIKKE